MKVAEILSSFVILILLCTPTAVDSADGYRFGLRDKEYGAQTESCRKDGNSRRSDNSGSGRAGNLLSGGLSRLDMDDQWELIQENLEPYFGAVVDTIIISGNVRTRRETIVREMATKQDEPLEKDLIRRDASYLRGLGFFSQVDIAAEKATPGNCKILVEVAERPGLFMKYPYPIVNYDLDKGVSYGFKWRVKNFRGVGERFSLSFLKRREREHGGDISWVIPWLAGRRIRFYSRLFMYKRLDEPGSDDYIKENYGGIVAVSLPFSRSLVRQVWLSSSIAFERRSSRLSINEYSPLGILYSQNFLSVGLSFEFDSRDNRISPRTGVQSSLSLRRYMSVRGLDQDYILYRLSSNFYVPAGKAGSFILSISGDIREGDLPSLFDMGLGGTSDLRGFEDEDLRGKVKILTTVQWRRRFFGPNVFDLPKIGKFDLTLNWVVFVDNGALMESVGDLGDSTFHTTGGLGIEIISPIQDLMRIELAHDGYGSPVYYLTSGSRF